MNPSAARPLLLAVAFLAALALRAGEPAAYLPPHAVLTADQLPPPPCR